MGFWHTGYMEFHEPVGWSGLDVTEPTPIEYLCHECGRSFISAEELRTHRFEAHPAHRPILIVRGVEVGNTALRLTRPVEMRDVEVLNATQATVNGESMPVDSLAQKLASQSRGTADVTLRNSDITARFTIRFEIATHDDIIGIEECFEYIAIRGRLDRRSIEDFIEQARAYPTAIAYCDGICDYLFGVLAKERSTESSLKFDAYREKFNRAAESLGDIDRPLARLIYGLVHFNFNYFVATVNEVQSSRLKAAANQLFAWVNGKPPDTVINRQYRTDSDSVLTDSDTERILRWILASEKDAQLQLTEVEAAIQEDLAEFDRVKLRILLSETYLALGDFSRAIQHARELINSPHFENWALRIERHCKGK